MTTFVDAALSLILLYAVIQFFVLYRKQGSQLLLWYSLGSLLYLFTSLNWIVTDFGLISTGIIENANPFGWTRVIGISFFLVALGIENWLDRPQMLRFPYIFTQMPLLLILSFFFVFETAYLNEIILGIYEGGALLVAVLLFGFFMSRDGKYLIPVAGVSTLLLAVIVYWFPGDVVTANSWIWKLIIIIGTGTFTYGYQRLIMLNQSSGNDSSEHAVQANP